MADYVIPENIAIVIGTAATAMAGVAAKVATAVYKAKNDEITLLRGKIDVLQAEYKAVLLAQIEAEPARKAALEKIAVAMADQNQLLKDVLTKRAA